MKKGMILAGWMMMILAACGPNSSQTTERRVGSNDSTDVDSLNVQELKQVSFRVLSNYFVKNRGKQSDTAACFIFNSAAERDSILGIAKTMKNRIDTIDFESEIMAAVTLTPTELTQSLELRSATMSEDAVNLHFAIQQDTTPKKSFTTATVWVGAIPRDMNVKKVKFYSHDKLMESINVGK